MSTASDGHHQIAKSAKMLGIFTSISRVLGFIRDMVIATAFGTGLGAEAFVVSFKIPNLLRDLVGEGATNAAFVPVLTECKEKHPSEFWKLVSTLFWVMAGVLVLLTIMGMVFTPQIVLLIAPGFKDAADAQKFPLTVHLTRTIFPYILLIGLSALAMGVLNTLKEFRSSAVGPALLNLCLIVAGVLFERKYGPMALVVGVLIGGAVQLVCQIGPLIAYGFRWNSFGAAGDYGRKIAKLLLPRAVGSALYQINVFVDSIFASFEHWVGAGGQSALYYSNRLFQLPLAIFGIAMAQAVLPSFSTQMIRKDIEGFKRTFSMAVRSLLFIVTPATMGLAILNRSIVRVLFEHGKFDSQSTAMTSEALFYYALGLLSCCFIKILVNAFYAMQDTRTPVKTMLVAVLFNVGASFVLMKFLRLGGLALASTLSATINGLLLYRALSKRLGELDEARIVRSFGKIAASSSVMSGAAWCGDRFFLQGVFDYSRAVQLAILLVVITVCIAVYYAASMVFGVEEVKRIYRG